jgi:hypothetical protein
MDIIQSLSLIALLSMLIYLVFVNIFATKTVQTSGSVIDLLPTPAADGVRETSANVTTAPAVTVTAAPSPAPCPFPMPGALSSRLSNKLPESGPDASVHPQSSIFSSTSTASSTSGINAQNQDIYEKQADFGSDVTNIKQFYKNNPEVFSKILCPPTVTNVADWERQSKELYDSAQSAPSGPIQAANFESNFMSSL